ncbi:PREDICTED: cob(I)yrinic acid a,c-diamide adenosyltransferase, mitochondrial-like [Ceratosolen solmsi marchali]|uniref:Cob(I)yrinic acid a,c-diamide adenosyltransferase, mitochondrial-like n=1 Tax=Ceratosolen solmsi marchali TaxID=326594 RepID=A0AAJ6YY04_9HYME|nr:PREDICTED: cob(I)yrinic acid a,c-diamide adenosyltransferase, mitochondrial-like [Ceratosolen solmsi marchali]XP_011506523.1 PREDICTED: cob(I)yrinic acid a,c-diamide adenosyltransferase, mitochondrial-like [Ceratosolen solmsi marchali]
MELARNLWRRSLFAYKSNMQMSIRNSLINPSNINSDTTSESLNVESKLKNKKVEIALGATEELSSYIGLAREFATDSKEVHPYIEKLRRIQMILLDLHYTIKKAVPGKTNLFENRHTQDLDEWIMEYSKQLPPHEDYIIPGGGKACASLHIARTICKKVEDSVIPLINNGLLDKEAQIYLKRLTDFLLTTSRMAAKCDNRSENIYIPRGEVSKHE